MNLAANLPTESLEIWRNHERWLRTVTYSRLREFAAVEDVLQETAMALVRAATASVGTFPQDELQFGPWLYRVAIRQVLLYRRRMGRQKKLTAGYSNTMLRDHQKHSPDALGWLMAEERQRQVREAIERLPARDAEILLLKYTEDWSYQQISEKLGLSHAAVESRLHRARAKLREELKHA